MLSIYSLQVRIEPGPISCRFPRENSKCYTGRHTGLVFYSFTYLTLAHTTITCARVNVYPEPMPGTHALCKLVHLRVFNPGYFGPSAFWLLLVRGWGNSSDLLSTASPLWVVCGSIPRERPLFISPWLLRLLLLPRPACTTIEYTVKRVRWRRRNIKGHVVRWSHGQCLSL